MRKLMIILCILHFGYFFSQNFQNKSASEIAQMFINDTNYGKDKVKTKLYQNRLHAYVMKKYNDDYGPAGIEVSTIFSRLFKLDKPASFEFIMTMKDFNSLNIVQYFSKEEKAYIQEKVKERKKKYIFKKNITPNSNYNKSVQNKSYEYDNMGFYATEFSSNSKFKIFFPVAKLYSNYTSTLNVPMLKYQFRHAERYLVQDLEYKRTRFNGSEFASVRLHPNTYNFPLSASQSSVVYAVAVNHLYPTITYKKTQQEGGYYIMESTINPIGEYNSIVSFPGNIVMKAYMNRNKREVIIQMVKTRYPVSKTDELTKEEKHFLLNSVKMK